MKWSKSEVNKLVRLRNQGVSFVTIARMMGRNEKTVYAKMASLRKKAQVIETATPEVESSNDGVTWVTAGKTTTTPILTNSELVTIISSNLSREIKRKLVVAHI